jgi:hypothetical protein
MTPFNVLFSRHIPDSHIKKTSISMLQPYIQVTVYSYVHTMQPKHQQIILHTQTHNMSLLSGPRNLTSDV